MSEATSERRTGVSLFLVVLMLFFLSGSAGLVYQVIWVRLLTRIFGTTTFALSALLAAFMAGLGLGSYLGGRFLTKRRSPLLWFGIVEGGIGLYALLLGPLLDVAEAGFLTLTAGRELGLYAEGLSKTVLSFLVLLPPTTLMGASLPLLVQHTVDRMHYLSLRTGSLYALNTLGAAFGCFAAGFYAIPHWGLVTTTHVAASLNAFVAVAALVLGRVYVRAPEKAREATEVVHGSEGSSAIRLALWAFGVSGFAALGLEVVWTRLFTLVFKGYTYSFSAMLTVLLAGLALGSIAFANRADRTHDARALLGRLQLAIALSVMLLAPTFLYSEGWIRYLSYVFGYGWSGQTMAKFVVSVVAIGLPTFLFGAQFPVVARIATDRVAAVGGRVGDLYAANVVGGILGALGTGYVLVPLVGTESSLWLLALALAATGGILLGKTRPRLVAALAGLVVVLGILPLDLSRRIHEGWLHRDESIRFYDEGVTATVMVAELPFGSGRSEKRILVNGSSASNSSEYGQSVNRVQGCLPFLFERMPRRVLATCFGTGITFGTLTQFDIEALDAVDISPEVIEAAVHFREENYDVVESDRVTIHIDDGRNFLLKSREKYDVITMEPMPPALAGVSDLYTLEFYHLVREHLNPGGIMSQWVPLYFLTLDDVKMLYRTFAEAFPHVMVFSHTFDTFLVGSNEPLRLAPEKFRERLRSPELIADLEEIDLRGVDDILSRFLMDREGVLAFAGDAPIVTDDLPYVEFSAPKAIDIGTTAGNYLAVMRFIEPPMPHLAEGSGDVFDSTRESLERLYRERYEILESAWEAEARWKRARDRAQSAVETLPASR